MPKFKMTALPSEPETISIQVEDAVPVDPPSDDELPIKAHDGVIYIYQDGAWNAYDTSFASDNEVDLSMVSSKSFIRIPVFYTPLGETTPTLGYVSVASLETLLNKE